MVNRIRVGVTGHRVFIKSDLKNFTRSLIDVFSLIESESTSERPLLFSGLADGADCEVAVSALLRGWDLVAVLAAPAADFSMEHETPEKVAVFNKLLDKAQRVVIAAPPGTTSPLRYCMVGEQIIATIDHLIAVWDGDTSNPKAGGTAWVVERFLHNGLERPKRLHHIKVKKA